MYLVEKDFVLHIYIYVVVGRACRRILQEDYTHKYTKLRHTDN